MKKTHTIDNLSVISDADGNNPEFACSTCGERFAQSVDGATLPILLFRASMFILSHYKCKRKKKIKSGTPVTDLSGSYLGEIKKINKNKKTAIVKDNHAYRGTHKISELFPIQNKKL